MGATDDSIHAEVVCVIWKQYNAEQSMGRSIPLMVHGDACYRGYPGNPPMLAARSAPEADDRIRSRHL